MAESGDRDGLPNVICEAMASGVPVVATPVAGVPEAIRDGETGLLVPGFDAEDWRAALKRLRDEDGFYLRLRDAARVFARENFDIDVNARMLADCFRAAAAGGEARTSAAKAGSTTVPAGAGGR